MHLFFSAAAAESSGFWEFWEFRVCWRRSRQEEGRGRSSRDLGRELGSLSAGRGWNSFLSLSRSARPQKIPESGKRKNSGARERFWSSGMIPERGKNSGAQKKFRSSGNIPERGKDSGAQEKIPERRKIFQSSGNILELRKDSRAQENILERGKKIPERGKNIPELGKNSGAREKFRCARRNSQAREKFQSMGNVPECGKEFLSAKMNSRAWKK